MLFFFRTIKNSIQCAGSLMCTGLPVKELQSMIKAVKEAESTLNSGT